MTVPLVRCYKNFQDQAQDICCFALFSPFVLVLIFIHAASLVNRRQNFPLFAKLILTDVCQRRIDLVYTKECCHLQHFTFIVFSTCVYQFGVVLGSHIQIQLWKIDVYFMNVLFYIKKLDS